jgi:hypothetical protein
VKRHCQESREPLFVFELQRHALAETGSHAAIQPVCDAQYVDGRPQLAVLLFGLYLPQWNLHGEIHASQIDGKPSEV